MSLVVYKHKVKRVIGKTPAGNNKTKAMIAEEVHVMNGDKTHCNLSPEAQLAVDYQPGANSSDGAVITVVAPGVKLLTLAPEQLVPGMEVCYICKYWALRFDDTSEDVKEALTKHEHSN